MQRRVSGSGLSAVLFTDIVGSTAIAAVWVGDGGGSLCRVDTTTLDVEELPVGAEVLGVGVDEATDAVWAYLGKALELA